MQSHENPINLQLGLHDAAYQAAIQEVYYHVPWRLRGVQAGSHRTNMRGAGSDFSSFVPFLNHPDPKRLDIRASLKTVPRQLMVKTFFERSAVKVYVVNDLSSSMQFSGKLQKSAVLMQIAQTLAWSVIRQGDFFAMISCNDLVEESMDIPLTHRKSASNDVVKLLTDYFCQPLQDATTASAMPSVAKKIGAQKSLVFLISDFYWPDELLHQTLSAFSAHDIVPIVLWDQSEFDAMPEWGWAKLVELETGRQRSFFMRPALHKSMRDHALNRKQTLSRICQLHGARLPFFVENGFDAIAMTRHLLGYT